MPSLEYIDDHRSPQPTADALTTADKLCKNILMATVLQFNRRLPSKPEIPPLSGIAVRHFAGESDIPAWLELRHRAFARQRIGVRQWTEADFQAEFTDRWWWQPQRMWLADNSIAEPSPLGRGQVSAGDSLWRGEGASHQIIGTVALAMRGEQAAHARPVVHWLMVHPRWRRRGLGRLLMAHLETAAWDAGHRELWLETHVAWEAAVKFYESLGYTAC